MTVLSKLQTWTILNQTNKDWENILHYAQELNSRVAIVFLYLALVKIGKEISLYPFNQSDAKLQPIVT